MIVITIACFAASQSDGFREWQCNQINNEQARTQCLDEIGDGR